MKRTRRNHGAAFKTQVAFAAGQGEKMLAELAPQFGVPPTQTTEWKPQLLTQAVGVCGGMTKATMDRNILWCSPRERLVVVHCYAR